MTLADGGARHLTSTLLLLAVIACRQGNTSADAAVAASGSVMSSTAVCPSDSLRPATAAPAEGLWSPDAPDATAQVSALVGPAHPDAGRARITRRVESLELTPGETPIHHALDTASVQLELLPPFGTRGSGGDGLAAAQGSESAAVYAITPFVLLASYEPCAATGEGEPRIRYVRRDARGAVVTDVMLRREPTDGKGSLR